MKKTKPKKPSSPLYEFICGQVHNAVKGFIGQRMTKKEKLEMAAEVSKRISTLLPPSLPAKVIGVAMKDDETMLIDIVKPLTCHRCGHSWYPSSKKLNENPHYKPKRCPGENCKSKYWDRPRTLRKGK